MPDALIGHTGFVGGNLLRQRAFDDTYNSSNIEAIRGRRYGTIVCSAMPAEKWKANRDPERDRATLDRLTACLGEAEAEHVVLISTVDVYARPVDVDEDTPVDPASASAYGRHRHLLEQFVRERFDCTIVRLPALFGPGLKKNVVYDLLHGNMLDAICPESVFQFYPLARLTSDVDRARRASLPLVNLAVEGITVREMARAAFGVALENPCAQAPVRYDMRTRHAALLGGAEGSAYIAGRDAVLAALRDFVRAERATARA